MNNPKLLKIAIIALLLLNLATMSFMLLHRPLMGPAHRGEETYNYLVHEINMTEDQQNQYKKLRDEHHESMERLQEKSREMHNAFFKLLQNPSSDSMQVKLMCDSITGNQLKIEMLTFDHFKKVRTLCTPQQQKKFDEIIQETLKRMAPKPAPR